MVSEAEVVLEILLKRLDVGILVHHGVNRRHGHSIGLELTRLDQFTFNLIIFQVFLQRFFINAQLLDEVHWKCCRSGNFSKIVKLRIGKLHVLTGHAIGRSLSAIEVVGWTIVVGVTAVLSPFRLITLLYFFKVDLVDSIDVLFDKILSFLGLEMDFLDQVLGNLDLRFILWLF